MVIKRLCWTIADRCKDNRRQRPTFRRQRACASQHGRQVKWTRHKDVYICRSPLRPGTVDVYLVALPMPRWCLAATRTFSAGPLPSLREANEDTFEVQGHRLFNPASCFTWCRKTEKRPRIIFLTLFLSTTFALYDKLRGWQIADAPRRCVMGLFFS